MAWELVAAADVVVDVHDNKMFARAFWMSSSHEVAGACVAWGVRVPQNKADRFLFFHVHSALQAEQGKARMREKKPSRALEELI